MRLEASPIAEDGVEGQCKLGLENGLTEQGIGCKGVWGDVCEFSWMNEIVVGGRSRRVL